MVSFESYILKQQYQKVAALGDKLSRVDELVNWQPFRKIVSGIYDNTSPKGGRPNTDPVLMIKLLLLQAWYGLSDQELEYQSTNRIDFMRFLGFPDKAPDYSTVWRFRERLAKTGKDKEIWNELQRQLDARGLAVKKGVMQDATFITADPGRANPSAPRGDEAQTRRNKEGTWVKKGGKSYYGYKLHSKVDRDFQLIRAIETTPSSVHDSQVDLSLPGEVVYRDSGYFGRPCNGYGATMQRGVRDHPIGIRDQLRNKRISSKRTPVERHYAVIKAHYGSGHVRVTTLARTRVKNTFACFGFNLDQLATLRRQGVA
jgi:IS5 family transposase